MDPASSGRTTNASSSGASLDASAGGAALEPHASKTHPRLVQSPDHTTGPRRGPPECARDMLERGEDEGRLVGLERAPGMLDGVTHVAAMAGGVVEPEEAVRMAIQMTLRVVVDH